MVWYIILQAAKQRKIIIDKQINTVNKKPTTENQPEII